jgi:PD-(D/E)XK nuclease superfamily
VILYDNTRLSAYRDCPRLFFFRHVLHWRAEGLQWPLVFGSAWHSAMDYVWRKLLLEREVGPINHELIARGAYKKFVEEWIEQGAPAPEQMDYEMQQEIAPRTPLHAYEMLIGYVTNKAKLVDDMELVATEKPFAVPMDAEQEIFYIGKIDKQVRLKSNGRIRGIEHKTTTAYRKGGPFRAGYIDSFSPNSQVDGYLFALHMMHPNDVDGIWVDASLVHKTEEGFMFIPVDKQLRMLDAWIWETRDWIERVEADKLFASKLSPDAPYMKAFPKNTNSCWNFNRQCPYMYCCKAWPNPLGKPVPPNMVVDKWNPLKELGPIEGLEDAEDGSAAGAYQA